MRMFRNTFVTSTLTLVVLITLFASTTVSAFASTPIVGASVELWDDTNGDGAYGGAGDTLVDSTTTDLFGSYILDANGDCTVCGVVIDAWAPIGDEIDSFNGVVDAWAPGGDEIDAGFATIWNDDNADGAYGTNSDSVVDDVAVSANDSFQVNPGNCSACSIVIDAWAPIGDEIDGIGGSLTATTSTATNQRKFDAWAPGGDDIDAWAPGGDDIDAWAPGGDDIDAWAPGGDDIDAAGRSR